MTLINLFSRTLYGRHVSVFFCLVSILSGVWLSGQETKPVPKAPEMPTLAPPVTPVVPPVEEGTELTAAEHPWGRFNTKSWTCMQTIAWTLQDGERTVSVRDTKTMLESIEKDGLTLKKHTTVNMGGKRIEAPAVLERFDFYRQPIQNDVAGKDVGTEKLVVSNAVSKLVIPCKKRVYEHVGPAGRQKTTLWYTTQLYPYVLRIQSVLTTVPSEKEPEERILSKSTTEVFESSAFHLRRSKLGTYRYRTRTTDSNITTVVEATCSRHIPGGIIHETTREFDASGTEIRTIETRLINYYCEPFGAEELPSILPDDPFYYFEPVPIRPRWRRFYAVPAY